MRDAFGGVFMIKLFLVFIVIYVAFSAISLNYAKAFRIKNKIIDFIEENEIIDLNTYFSKGNNKALKELNQILDDANYNKECKNGNGVISSKEGTTTGYCYNGIVIELTEKVSNTQTYTVYTYADWNLGVLNMILALGGQNKNSQSYVNGTWEISGEAKVVIRK